MDRGQPRHYSNSSRLKMELLISPVRSHRSKAMVHPSPSVINPGSHRSLCSLHPNPATELSHICAVPLQLRDVQPWSPIQTI